MRKRIVSVWLMVAIIVHISLPVLANTETEGNDTEGNEYTLVADYQDEESFLKAVQEFCDKEPDDLFGKSIDENMGAGKRIALRMQYLLEYMDEFRNAKYEDWKFQKLSDLYFGGAQVLASSDIFDEGAPMNYALLDYGMTSYLTALEFMREYYGIELPEDDVEQITIIFGRAYDTYTLENEEQK